MKLTKTAELKLVNVLNRINRAVAYLEKDTTIICSPILPNAQSFYDHTGKGISPVTKFVGSELYNILHAKNELENILNLKDI